MNHTIHKEMLFPQPREQVWAAIANAQALAEWMYPNDFEPQVGHPFTFQVPPNPKAGFDGLVVRCQVLTCEPPSQLVFSWSVDGPVANTQVRFHLEPEGHGTRLRLEHSGFDLAHPWGKQAFKGAGFGWAKMLKQLGVLLASNTAEEKRSISDPQERI